MSEVIRYDIMSPDYLRIAPDGDLVRHEDYQTIRDERDRLRSALTELVESCDAAGKSGHHVAVGIRMKLSNAKAALTPAEGGQDE